MASSLNASLGIGDLLDILPDAVLMVDGSGHITYVNPAVSMLLGYKPQELLAQPVSVLIPHEARARHEALVARFHRVGAPTMMGSRAVLHAVHRAGHMVPVSVSLCNLSLSDGEFVSVAVIHDVSSLHTHLDRATAKAETDPLTGLGNRVRLTRFMHAMLAGARPFALLFLDLERFKKLNDRHGHAAGDEALCIVGQRLQAQVRKVDVVVRLGGDEFVMLLDGVNDEAQLRRRAMVVLDSVTRPLRINAAGASVGVNIGGAISPRHGTTAQALLAAADRAMYAAKQAGEGYQLAADV